MRYTKKEQVVYQINKIKYHFQRLKKLGLSDKEILEILTLKK